MSPFAALLAAAAASLPVPTPAAEGMGAQVESVEARAAIVEAAVVRQGSGFEAARDRPMPQAVRRGRIVQVEFQ